MADKIHEISLDCAPGNRRPSDCFPSALDGTGLVPNDFKITSKCFGEWTFQLKSEKNDIYEKNVEKIRYNIEKLYNKGYIRYGSWS